MEEKRMSHREYFTIEHLFCSALHQQNSRTYAKRRYNSHIWANFAKSFDRKSSWSLFIKWYHNLEKEKGWLFVFILWDGRVVLTLNARHKFEFLSAKFDDFSRSCTAYPLLCVLCMVLRRYLGSNLRSSLHLITIFNVITINLYPIIGEPLISSPEIPMIFTFPQL